ncbi:MAG: rod shape-determining protein MreC [Acutalibacteraceae bacterium]|jgi:rod shape-determining protein MreC
MRFFFRSKQFKIILAVTLALITVSVTCIVVGGKIAPQADLAGTVMAPFRAAATKVSNGFKDVISAFKDGNRMMLENAELESQLNELRSQLADYEKLTAENKFYKDYLEIKDKHPDFEFTPATLISRDENDAFKGFTINKGSLDGISEHDPVITDAGLVGYISQVGLSTSKVMTILSPDLTLGALDNRTSDSGIVYGALGTAKEGLTGFYNLPRSCTVAVGDYVITSGEGIFPSGLLVGSIQDISSEKYNTSIYATIKPFADLDNLRNVMVITDFEGQGGLKPGK